MPDNQNIVGIGIDIEDIHRFKEKDIFENPTFYKILFTDNEIAYCKRHRDPYPHFTARFCCKEALKKALSPYISLGWRDSEIQNKDNGEPYFVFRKKDEFLESIDVFVSLSHEKDKAIAFVVVQKK